MGNTDYDLKTFNQIWEQGLPQEGDYEEKVHQLVVARNRRDYFAAGDVLAGMFGRYPTEDISQIVNRAEISYDVALILAVLAVRIPEGHPVRGLNLPIQAAQWVALYEDPICTELAFYIRYKLNSGMTWEEIDKLLTQQAKEYSNETLTPGESSETDDNTRLRRDTLERLVHKLEVALKREDHFAAGDLLQILESQFGALSVCKVVQALQLDWVYASTLTTICRTYPKDSPIRDLGLPINLLTLLLQVPTQFQVMIANKIRAMLDSGMTPDQIIQQFYLP